ncbi:hypothetical protein KIW84_043538 [Lathyrus oleraceus]|uniref:Retroviral polymerase SH3-like domain-containing protein n=1 Tax=Pisum sativum TaxID=3888 RepID=A0A9D4XHP0_PEA|nr:hypothetical protein KIW84_043538 [Pisum sativum]
METFHSNESIISDQPTMYKDTLLFINHTGKDLFDDIGYGLDMHSLKVFGSLAFASTLHMHRTKLEPRGRKCVFLGYKNGMKGVILYDINSHTILVSRNVIHHEHIFPYSNINSTNWNYHPYKDPTDSPQNEPIIPVPSQSIESTTEEHEHHPNTTIDTLHHSSIEPESLENTDENHDTQSVPDTPDIDNI